ncbi:MAG TPA: hypothetical protein VEV84_01735, partial [Pyrinomonadaceae bacterium]|nr:hypothetical protein [Pyrinomonadaceae bacterium]
MSRNLQAPAPANIAIREIDRRDEMRAVEQLQKEVWGVPDLDVVPLTQLVAAKATGGVLLGALDNEILIGFVYGFVGCEQGQMIHHSHMLAVKPAYRNFNIGYKLKRAQRDFVLAQGITEITWTFDPLQSLNAHFNFGRLGVISDRYLIDFYGTDAASFLHHNGTDRLWVTWLLTSEHVRDRIEQKDSNLEFEHTKPLVEIGQDSAPLYYGRAPESLGDEVFIEIPTDINVLERQNPELAAAWRGVTRAAFTEA